MPGAMPLCGSFARSGAGQTVKTVARRESELASEEDVRPSAGSEAGRARAHARAQSFKHVHSLLHDSVASSFTRPAAHGPHRRAAADLGDLGVDDSSWLGRMNRGFQMDEQAELYAKLRDYRPSMTIRNQQRARARARANTHTRTHSRTHALTHSRTHSLTHARTHAHTHARTQPIKCRLPTLAMTFQFLDK